MANVWINPVFDRTREDVEFAIRKIAEWKQGHTHFTGGNDVYDLKGCLNVTDLNRIEENIAYLADKLEAYSYPAYVSTRPWDRGGVPTQRDVSRIVENIKSLLSSFYSPNNAPALPNKMSSYEDINAIEENLYLIKVLLDGMEGSFKVSGVTKSGAKMFLPTRR